MIYSCMGSCIFLHWTTISCKRFQLTCGIRQLFSLSNKFGRASIHSSEGHLFCSPAPCHSFAYWKLAEHKDWGALMSQSSLLIEVAACVRNEARNRMPVQGRLHWTFPTVMVMALPLPHQRVGVILLHCYFYLPPSCLQIISEWPQHLAVQC